LLGAPQYAIAGVIAGGGGYASAGIIGILVFVVAMLLLFKDTSRDDVFDMLMGFNRWCLRALAYAAFMTPQYPPFRFDPGPREPTGGQLPPPGSTPPTAA
jgi:hypothetical protein